MTLLPRLCKAWRVAGTAISFASFGVGGLSLSLLWIPLLCLPAGSEARRRRVAQFCIHTSFRFFVRMMRALGVIDYRVENAAAFAADSGCLIVANHPTLLDYVFLVSLMPDCDCIVKEALWNNFFMRGVIRRAGYIPNRNAGQLLDECRRRLADGNRILIFPEGTRTQPGQPARLQRGAANIAVRCHADIRVVHISCAPLILSKQHKWWQTADTRPVFTIRVSEKISTAAFAGSGVSDGHAARLLNENLYRAFGSA
jgi:1-acyl-sn-glycerol-3-phosphate acyltransferase